VTSDLVAAAFRPRTISIERRAVAAVVAAVVLWSASSLFVRAGDADALVFTTWRLWFALPPLAVIVALRARDPKVEIWPRGVSRMRWVALLFGAGAFFGSGVVTAFAAFGLTRLLDVTLIGALQPILIIAFAVAFLGEHVAKSNVLRAVVAIGATIAVALAASSSGSWSLAGDVVAVISLALNAGWFLYGRVLRTRYAVDPFAFMFGVLAAAAVLITPVAWVHNGGFGMRGVAIAFAACTMVSGTTAHVLMVWAHRYVPTSVSSPLLLGEPPIVALGAWFWFGEALGPVEVIGSAVVVASLWGVVRSAELEHVEDDAVDPAPPT
jgi:drug/metabolite transporter (DMT)-like permease